MDIVDRLNLMISDETTTGDIALPPGEVIGMTYRKKKKKNKLGTETVVHETTYAGGSASVATIVGSGQTRVVGDKEGEIDILKTKPRPLKWNKLFGAYLPDIKGEIEKGDNE